MTDPSVPTGSASEADVDFDAAYLEVPPWEIGAPQPVLADLAQEGWFEGPVLDVGCGTGENALELARYGLEVMGIDSSPGAIEQAKQKAAQRSLSVEFSVRDAHELASLSRRFPTVVDSALLHVISGKTSYAEQLSAVLEPDGRLLLLEISDAADIPYPKITEAEIRTAFSAPLWQIESLGTATYETHIGTFPAWLGVVRRSRE